MPADRLGSRLQSARILGSLAAPVTIRDAVDPRDRNDVARFRLSSRSTLTLQVGGLRRDSAIGVDVFTPKSTAGKAWQRLRQTDLGQLKLKEMRQRFNFFSRSNIASGSNASGSTRSISVTLDAGEYYLRLYARKNSTPYRLVASATPIVPAVPLPPQPPAPPGPPAPPSPPAPPLGFPRQDWIRQFGTSGNDYAYGVSASPDGNTLFVSGSSSGSLGGPNAGDRDSFVAQLSSQGNLTALRQFGRAGIDVAADVVADSAGNYYVSGVDVVTESLPILGATPNPNGYVAKYSPDGRELWRQTIATTTTLPFPVGLVVPAADAASRLAIDAQGNVYVTGLLQGIPDGGFGFSRPSKAFVVKYDSSGNQQWLTELDLAGASGGTDITLDAAGNIYLSGITNATLTTNADDPLTNGDAFVAKLNGSGSTLWQQTIAAPGTNLARGVAVDRSGNVYITGDTASALPEQTSAGGTDAFLAKYDSSGNRQWLKQFGTNQLDESQAIAIDNQDRIYLAGETTGSLFGNAPIGQSDAWLAAFDAAGTLLRSTQIGTPQNDEVYGLTIVNATLVGASPLVYLVGQTQGTFPNSGITNQGNYDAWAAQYSFNPA